MLPGTLVLLAGLMFDGRELKPLLAEPRPSSAIDPFMAIRETAADRAELEKLKVELNKSLEKLQLQQKLQTEQLKKP